MRPLKFTVRAHAQASTMTNFFRREARFMLVWLILVPVVTLVVGMLAVFFLHYRRG